MSSRTQMAKRPKTKSKKEQGPVVAYFRVNFIDNPENMFSMRIYNLNKDIPKMERLLEKWKSKWNYALLCQVPTNQILSYYHPINGANPIDKETYTKLFKKSSYSLYIIPTRAYKRKVGSHKAISQKVSSLDDVVKYDNENVLRIDVYQKGKIVKTFKNGKFLK